MSGDVHGWADFSEEKPDPRCRFALGRDFVGQEHKAKALFAGLNPSRAGADVNDMTVSKGMGFARLWDLGGTIHVNAYPFITPYPDELRQCTVEEMERNDRRLVVLAATAKVVVLAWGSFPRFKERFWKVARLLAPFNPVCLGRTGDGYPKHISRIAYAAARVPWRTAQEMEKGA